jgi:hypothetical protein
MAVAHISMTRTHCSLSWRRLFVDAMVRSYRPACPSRSDLLAGFLTCVLHGEPSGPAARSSGCAGSTNKRSGFWLAQSRSVKRRSGHLQQGGCFRHLP